MGWRLVGW